MGTYYIIKDPQNPGKIRYLINEWPAMDGSTGTGNTNIASMLSTLNASGNTFVFSRGTYSGTELASSNSTIPAISATSQTLRCALSNDPNYLTHLGEVIFDGIGRSANTLSLASYNDSVIQGLTFINPPSTRYSVVSNTTCNIISCKFLGAGRPLSIYGTSKTATIKYSVFAGCDYLRVGDTASSGHTANFYYNILRPGDDTLGGDSNFFYGPSIAYNVNASSTDCSLNIYNNVFSGYSTYAIYYGSGTPTGGTLNIKNNIFTGGNSKTASTVVRLGTNNSGLFDYNLVNMNGRHLGSPLSLGGVSSGTNNKYTSAPKIVSSSRRGILLFSKDDTKYGGGNGDDYIDIVKPISDKLNAIGAKLTWYVNALFYGTDIINHYKQHIYAGNEIGFHGTSHTYFNVTNVFSVTSTGSGTPTIDIDRGTGKIILKCTEGTYQVPASGDFRTTTVSSIVSEINALTYFDCTMIANPMYSRGEILQDTLGDQLIGSGYTVIADRSTGSWDGTTYIPPSTGFFKYELYDGISAIENALGYGTGYIKSFSYPGTLWDSTSRTALMSVGSGQLLFARSQNLATVSSDLSYLDLYNVACITSVDLLSNSTGGSTEDNLRANINGLCSFLAENGGIAQIYVHALSTSGLTLDQWDIIIDEIQKWADLVDFSMSAREAGEALRLLPYTYNSGYTSRTWSDNSDYHLKINSPCINSGTNISGLTIDFEGNKLPKVTFGFNPDIGAYDTFKGAMGTLITAVYTPYASTAIPSGIDINICTASDNAGTTGYLQKLANASGTIECPAMHDGTTKALLASSFDKGFNFYITQWSYDLGTMRSGKFNNATLQIDWGTSVAFNGQFPVDASNKLRVFYGGDKYPIKLGKLYMYDRVLTDKEIKNVISGSGITGAIQYIVDMQGNNVLDENGNLIIA